MDSKKLLYDLAKLKGRGAEETFQKFQEVRQKFSDCFEGIYNIEKIIRGKDAMDADECFHSRVAFAYHDSCECIARQAFEYGVAYGKTLSA